MLYAWTSGIKVLSVFNILWTNRMYLGLTGQQIHFSLCLHMLFRSTITISIFTAIFWDRACNSKAKFSGPTGSKHMQEARGLGNHRTAGSGDVQNLQSELCFTKVHSHLPKLKTNTTYLWLVSRIKISPYIFIFILKLFTFNYYYSGLWCPQ